MYAIDNYRIVVVEYLFYTIFCTYNVGFIFMINKKYTLMEHFLKLIKYTFTLRPYYKLK